MMFLLYYLCVAMWNYELNVILSEIEKVYATKLQKNVGRVCTNIYNNFWITLPSNSAFTAEELCKLLRDLHDAKLITDERNGQLQRWNDNVVNKEIQAVGTILGWNTRVNKSNNILTHDVTIGAWSYLKDCEVIDSQLDWVIIEWGMFTKINKSHIKEWTVLFGGAKIRDSVIGEWNEIGQIEIVRSTTWKLIKALHRGFLGDAELWDNINVSNFFGIMNSSHEGIKAKVKIWNNVFLWGRSAIISGEKWITIWDDAVIAWGAVVLKDIPEGYIYISKDKMYPKLDTSNNGK